jgi:hypothetical protein
MNDDLGRMVLNPDVNVRSVELWKMFYVYSNDTGDYCKLKRKRSGWRIPNCMFKCLF